MKNSDRAHDTAESSFKKRERRISEGRKAMAEHDAAARAVDANTARLKALRLARDAAAEEVAPAKTAKGSPAKKKTSSAKKIAATPASVAVVIESEGERQQLLQEDHLKMADRDGTRAPTARAVPDGIKISD